MIRRLVCLFAGHRVTLMAEPSWCVRCRRGSRETPVEELDEVFPSRPWRGRRLIALRIQHLVLSRADLVCHRLHIHEHDGRWPCFESDTSELARLIHDQRYHDRRLPYFTRVQITGPPASGTS